MIYPEKGIENTFVKGLIDFRIESIESIENSSNQIDIIYYNNSIKDLYGIDQGINDENLKSIIYNSLIKIVHKFDNDNDIICIPILANNSFQIFTFYKKDINLFSLTIESILNSNLAKVILEANQSLLLINQDLKILSIINNDSYRNLIIPQNLIDRIHPKDKDLVQFALSNIRHENEKKIDTRFLDFDNVYRWKRLIFRQIGSPLLDLRYFIVINRDIEYLNSLENELMLFKQKFERILMVSRAVLWEVNSDGIFTYVSPNSELLWGLKPDQIVNKMTFYDIHPYNEATNPKLLVNEKTKILENELAFEFSHKINETKKLWLYCFSSIDYDKDGNFLTYYGWDIDISDRKASLDSVQEISDELNNAIADLRIVQEHLEEHMFYQNNLIDEISETKEQLEKSNNEKDKFFSIIAHDLRSPFSGFLGLTKMLEENIDNLEPDELKELAKMLKDSANITYALLENLLEWSRIQRNVIKFEPQETNLFLLVSNVMLLQRPNLEKKNIEVNLDVDENLTIEIDQNMINTVLRNLVSNAVKFTPKNGKISISAKENDDYVNIQIKDSGIGMPDSIKENLFNIGAKTSREGTDGESSSGLGLLLCKEYVEMHNSKIWVESQENVGSTFNFSISKSR